MTRFQIKPDNHVVFHSEHVYLLSWVMQQQWDQKRFEDMSLAITKIPVFHFLHA